MCCIPLIFTRPFQSIHLSLGNIAHPFLYASLYPLLYCATLIIVALNKAKRSLSPLLCSSESDRRVYCRCPCVRHREGYTCLCYHDHNRQLPLHPLSLWANWRGGKKQNKTRDGCLGFYRSQWMSSKREHKLMKQNAWQEFRFQGRWVPPERDRW